MFRRKQKPTTTHVTINVYGDVDPDQLADKVREALRQHDGHGDPG